jgi:transcriptional regulator with XRE-family HTH domain
MDDLAVGRVFRQLRIRLGWRASDVAARAGLSTSTYSRIERGDIARCRLGTLRKAGEVLEVRVILEPRWRGAGLDRFLARGHAAMAESISQMLVRAAWEVRPEVSFSHFGERGVVDLVAWHGRSRTLLLIELKTELADIGDLLTVTGRRRRLAAVIAEAFGWKPVSVGQWVVIAAGRSNERRVAAHRTLLRAAFPSDGRSIAGWLANPATPMSALWFLPNIQSVSRRRAAATPIRVRVPRVNVGRPAQSAERPNSA